MAISDYSETHAGSKPTAKVNDGNQLPMTFDSFPSESAGSRSLDRLMSPRTDGVD